MTMDNKNLQTIADVEAVQQKENQLKDWVSYAIKQAKSRGADAVEISASWQQGLSTTVRLGDVETLEFNRDQGFGVTVYYKKAKGSSSTNQLTKATIDEVIEAACKMATFTSSDPFAGLAEPELMATYFPELDIYHPWQIAIESAIAMAKECENVGRQHTEISNSDGASFTSHQSCHVYGNSHDFIGTRLGTRHSLSCLLLAETENEMQRDYWYDTKRDYRDLLEPAMIGRTAAERTVRRLHARPIKTQTAPVLFLPEVASGLLGHFINAVSGGNLYRSSSFLLGKLQQTIFPEHIEIIENPHRKKGAGSAVFDSDGVATNRKHLIKDGILASYVLGSYSARKLGMVSTGNAGGVHNIEISSAQAAAFEQLLQTMHKGLIVCELMGQGVNIVSGDYSRGAAGFWVENGEIQHFVQGVTIASNLTDMFKNIVAIGNDVDARGNIQTGSILIEKMAIAGSA